MGRQYYCDYCLRSFRDSAQNRKKHLKSFEHLVEKQRYFDSIKSSLDLLRDELNKTVCNHYYRNNFCKFGDNCIHSHLTYPRLQQLKEMAIYEEFQKNLAKNAAKADANYDTKTHFDIWLKNRFNSSSQSDSSDTNCFNTNNSLNFSELKQLFIDLNPQQIPVSLIPATIHEFNQSEECDWS